MSYKLPIFLTGFLLMVFPLAGQSSDDHHTTAFESFTGNITGSKVRIRTQPHLEAHVVREANYNEMYVVTNQENDFYVISPPKEMKGYIFRTFVLDGAVEGERVNVRLYPDIEAPIVAQLNTGDRVDAVVCEANNKWLEVSLPKNCHFYVAKEFMEKKGPVELLAQYEKKRNEASHKLSSAFLYASSEMQKPFEQLDVDVLNKKFETLLKEYEDLSDISEKAAEALNLFQDIYVQKKIAFLESKAERTLKPLELDSSTKDRLAKLGIDPKAFLERQTREERNLEDIGKAALSTMGLSSILSDSEITDKMLIWQPLEESLYHLWAAVNEEKGIEDFYEEERENAVAIMGIIEPYNKPVKNRPGDFLLKSDNLPVAFLYSTQIDLQKLSGKKATLMVSPRPNNNFAFPAYYVLSVE